MANGPVAGLPDRGRVMTPREARTVAQRIGRPGDARRYRQCLGGQVMRALHATRRAIPWRSLLSMAGTVLAIGGGIVCVSTPASGGIVVGLGLLALLGASAE